MAHTVKYALVITDGGGEGGNPQAVEFDAESFRTGLEDFGDDPTFMDQLNVGESLSYGGGASPVFTVTRIQ